ncbi:hypothetical protein AVEN_210022-1 [Araneus ventricosus]|uniref:Mariner Mos1 transposase n=1 Tax=Araneus ventricosus TaxID=182803 RepID=A0A4Y2I9C7_ARAVE|nr:hypothetical protein AVEN_210022-1 [Araneus ventricosus]
MFVPKEEQRGVIRFLVAKGVGVTLDLLCAAIKAKRSGLLSSGVVDLHDNARPHTATYTLNRLTEFGWAVLEHQPYSLDLSTCDFHNFGPLKKALKGRRSYSDNEVMDTIRNCFQSQLNNFYENGTYLFIAHADSLTHRVRSVLTVGGEEYNKNSTGVCLRNSRWD